MAWANWKPENAAAIRALNEVGSAIAPIMSTMESILSSVKAIMEVVSAILVDVPDLEASVIKAAIETVRAILKDLVGDAGCYFLPIPVHFKNVIASGDLIYDPTPGGSEPAAGGSVFLPPVGGGGGGNYGFLSDLIGSLHDSGDILKPEFDDDAHIAGMVVVAGADSFLDILPLIEKLKRLFSGKKKSGAGEGIGSTDGFSIPKTKQLKAEIVPSVVGQLQRIQNRKSGGGSTHPYGVKLTWELPERIQVVVKGYICYTFTIQKVHIFRAEKPDTFSTYANPTGLAKLYALQSFEFDGLLSSFYDDTIELNRTYTYGVGYEIEAKAETLQSDDTYVLRNNLTYDAAADAVTTIAIPNEINLLPRSGVPPDWMLFPNPLAMIPDLVEVVNSVNTFLDTLEERLDSASDKYTKFLAALTTEINRYVKLAENVLDTIQNIIDLLDFPDVYIGVYPFADKGGNSKLISIVGNALNDSNDPNRPPFDRGDEVLTGFVLYAGSATVGKLEAFITLMDMLVGTNTQVISTAYAQAAESIGTAVDEIERQISLLENLTTGTTSDTEDVLTSLGPDLEPAAEENNSTECS